MNYRHAFHAGNFADVMKHVLLVRMLVHLRRKDRPFRVVDTHAGIGLYDLSASEAARTGEWADGIGRMDAPFSPEVEAVLAPWRAVLAAVRTRFGPAAYPGSPAVSREMLRFGDRAVLVEKHPEDAARLAATYRDAHGIKVLALDGWTALGSLIPLPERRGLVLIDPPFEEPDEFARCAARLAKAVRRWPTGTHALWYPLKAPGEADKLARALRDTIPAPTLRLELQVDAVAGTRLAGGGLVVVNPPWTLAAEAELLLPALASRLARTDRAGFLVEPLVQEGEPARRAGPPLLAGEGGGD